MPDPQKYALIDHPNPTRPQTANFSLYSDGIHIIEPLHVAARNGLTVVVQELLGKGASVLAVDENGYTPALACAPNKDVADCLALILATMMPVSPGSVGSIPGLTFNAINHYSSPSKAVTFDPLPVLRSEHASYCSFNSLGREDGLVVPDDELNDSDSETY